MRKDVLWYILIGLFMLLCLGAIIFIGLVNSVWALAVGIFGWVAAAFACMILILKVMQLRYCRKSLTNALNTGMELAHKLGEQQFVNQQLFVERNQLIEALDGQIVPLIKKKKKIKN